MKDIISFNAFQKLDLRVGKILEAEEVLGSDKLVKLSVDLGSEVGTRQILAGVGPVRVSPPSSPSGTRLRAGADSNGVEGKYSIEDLVGRLIVVVVNLEPKSMMDLESQGMLLAASGEDGPVLLTVSEDVEPGEEVG